MAMNYFPTKENVKVPYQKKTRSTVYFTRTSLYRAVLVVVQRIMERDRAAGRREGRRQQGGRGGGGGN